MRLRALASQRGLIQQPRVESSMHINIAELGAAGGRPGEWAGPRGGTGSAVDSTPDADMVTL